MTSLTTQLACMTRCQSEMCPVCATVSTATGSTCPSIRAGKPIQLPPPLRTTHFGRCALKHAKSVETAAIRALMPKTAVRPAVSGPRRLHLTETWLRSRYDPDSPREFSASSSSGANRRGRPRASISATVTWAWKIGVPSRFHPLVEHQPAPPISASRVSTSSRSSSRGGTQEIAGHTADDEEGIRHRTLVNAAQARKSVRPRSQYFR